MHSANRRQLIAAEIRAELARQKLTIRDLAAATGYPYDIIRRRIAGDYPFDTDQLETIAITLGVPLASLLVGPAKETAA